MKFLRIIYATTLARVWHHCPHSWLRGLGHLLDNAFERCRFEGKPRNVKMQRWPNPHVALRTATSCPSYVERDQRIKRRNRFTIEREWAERQFQDAINRL